MSLELTHVLAELNRQIKAADKPANRANYQQFFKEKLAEPVGLRTSVLRKISNTYYRNIKTHDIEEIMNCCDGLLASGHRYMRFFAFDWADKLKGNYRPRDFGRFENWLKLYVDNWGACDHLCGPLGYYILAYPKSTSKVFRWTKSTNRWFKRASAVSLIVSVRDGKQLDKVFATADALLLDPDDMVQKGYGWTLKEACKHFEQEVFEYVLAHKCNMPRTALRYAIEKMPPAKKKAAMNK